MLSKNVFMVECMASINMKTENSMHNYKSKRFQMKHVTLHHV